ncbi:MAG: tRNA pseudouridine(55) synthase TruB [Actinomycetes bacterium]
MSSATGGEVTGLLVVDKPEGLTSHDVVGRARRALGTRKVGHAGTLDPMATGVLVLGVGRATRLLGLLALKDKAYEATIRLGSSTVTDDRTGDLLAAAEPSQISDISDTDIVQALGGFVGAIEQRPSSVSAIKVDGKRAYDLVRAGEDVELQARTVDVASIDVAAIRPDRSWIDVDVVVSCSTGTYVRAIARDLGDRLGVGGHLTSLRRTRVGVFELTTAVSLDDLAQRGPECLQAMSDVVPKCFPTWQVDAAQAHLVINGVRIPYAGPAVDDPVAILAPDGTFVALAVDADGRARYLAVFSGGSATAG